MIGSGKYLITCDNWFYAPDGQNYIAAWGEVTIIPDTALGIKTNARSANWYARVGTEDNHVIIAGCQIHYAVRCEERPSKDGPVHEETHEGQAISLQRSSRIYFTE